MAELFLHIGSNKTATTTLQYRLSRSTEALATAGLLYPETGQSTVGAHHLLAGHLCSNAPEIFSPQGDLEALLEQLRVELAAAAWTDREPRVVISSEMLFWFRVVDTEALQRLFDLFSTVRVIAYLRRQDSYLPSHYSSLVNNGLQPQSFEQFCTDINLNYLRNLDAWAEFIGADNIIARPFVRKFWERSDIATDFLSRVGCALTSEDLVDSEAKNQALSLEAIDVLLATGGASTRTDFPAFRDAVLAHFAATRHTSSQQLMTASILSNIRQRYASKNRELAQKYFATNESTALDFPGEQDRAADTYHPLAATDYAALLESIWEHQQLLLDNATLQQQHLQEQMQGLQLQLDETSTQLEQQQRLGVLYGQQIKEQGERLLAWNLELQALRAQVREHELEAERRRSFWLRLGSTFRRVTSVATG